MDRGGGRESKGWTLKKSKKNPGCARAKTKSVAKPVSLASLPSVQPGAGKYLDAGVALLSRQFDHDRERVLARARADDICSMVGWCPDIEKLGDLAALAAAHTGFVFFLAGVHPDNVSKTSRHKHDAWLATVEGLAKQSGCLGILSGLNLTRDIATHHAQAAMLESACQLADRTELPLVLHVAPDGPSLERAIDILLAQGWVAKDGAPHRRVVLHAAITGSEHDPARVATAVQAGFYCAVSAAGLTTEEEEKNAVNRQLVAEIPLEKLLLCSDAPWQTPQNHPDEYIRSVRNEPANLPFVAKVVMTGHEETADSWLQTVKSNAWVAFGLNQADHTAEVADLGVQAATALPANDGGNVELDGTPLLLAAVVPPISSGTGLAAVASSLYSCLRCRAELFTGALVQTHMLAAPLGASCDIAGEGLCSAAVFLSVEDVAKQENLLLRGGNVECRDCGQKLGRHSSGQAQCPCGATVPGPVLKLATAKLDYFDGVRDTTVLVARALEETLGARQEELDEEERAAGTRRARKKAKEAKKKKKVVGNNRSNFSEYRNKASLPAKKRPAQEDGETAQTTMADGSGSSADSSDSSSQ